MAIPSRSSARRSSPGSARHAAPSARGSAKSARSAPVAEEGDNSSKKSSTRIPRSSASDGRPGANRGARNGSSTGKSRPSITLYVIAGVALVGLVALFTVGPIRRSMALSHLDSFKSDPTSPTAIAAAEAFLELSGGYASHISSAILADRGPVEMQVYMAKKRLLFTSLVQIADRPLTGEAEGRPTVSVEQRTLAIQAGTEIYDSEKNAKDLLPDHIKDWARDPATPRELAIASMGMLVKAKAKDTADLLHQVAMAKDADPVRASAAIDGLAEIAEVSKVGFLIGLLTGPAGDLALTRPSLAPRIVALATPDHLQRLMELLDHPKDQIRAIAIEAMAGPNMRMSDTAGDLKKREDLGVVIATKLTPSTPPTELAAAIKAVRNLRLFGARDAILELAKDINSRQLEGIDQNFMAEVLGKSLISNLPEPEPAKDGKLTAEAEIAIRLRKQDEESINKLIAGLDDAALRPVAAKALSHIRDKTYFALREAVEKLATHDTEDACMDALITLVSKTYAREDIVKQCGRDPTRWSKFLESDRPRFDKIKEIIEWMAANGQYQYIKDGKERLGKSRDYLNQASEFVDAMLNEPKFLPPLGLTKTRIETLRQDMKMLGMNVRKAWAGALE